MLATAALSGDPHVDEEDLHATACAVYAVLLGATNRGLASYWRTPSCFTEEPVREALGLGPSERVVALIHLGPPMSAPPPWLSDLMQLAKSRLTVVLEITERAIADSPAELLGATGRMREQGMLLAVDDVLSFLP